MSEDLYYVNKTKKEFIRAYGNSNRSDSLRSNFPKLLIWLMSDAWFCDEIVCIGDSGDLDLKYESTERTNDYIEKYNATKYLVDEHGKLARCRYAKDKVGKYMIEHDIRT